MSYLMAGSIVASSIPC